MKPLDRLAILAGLDVKIEESRGLSEDTFNALTPSKQIKYIKEHPHSKYGSDPKWLKRAENCDRYGTYDYITDPKEIAKLIKVHHRVNKDGTVDVFENLIEDADHNKIIENLIDGNGHLKVKFRYAKGDFDCSSNKLTSLEGSPIEVGGDFYCECPQFTSLEGGPKKVNGHFDCSTTNITNLEGAPEEVGKSLICTDCKNLVSLKGSPKKMVNLFCKRCRKLKSLDGIGELYGRVWCAGSNKSLKADAIRRYNHKAITEYRR